MHCACSLRCKGCCMHAQAQHTLRRPDSAHPAASRACKHRCPCTLSFAAGPDLLRAAELPGHQLEEGCGICRLWSTPTGQSAQIDRQAGSWRVDDALCLQKQAALSARSGSSSSSCVGTQTQLPAFRTPSEPRLPSSSLSSFSLSAPSLGGVPQSTPCRVTSLPAR
jgi:hypothetical protein